MAVGRASTESPSIRAAWPRAVLPLVLQQHIEDAAHLRHVRSALVRSPHATLTQLSRLDDRLAAHLDGLAIGGEYGSRLALRALESPSAGEMFAAALRAIDDRDPDALEQILALSEALPDSHAGLTSAFGWVSASSLRGITQALLESPHAFRRRVGLAACSMHGADPGDALSAALGDADAALRARALRVAANLGRVDLLTNCAGAMADADAHCAFEAARAAVLLGDRQMAISALGKMTTAPGCWRASALALTLKLLAPAEAHAVLKALSQDPADVRLLIQGIGAAGDARYVPWLIQQMQDRKLMRLAGESFSLITGLDLADLDLEQTGTELPQTGPTDDADDEDVSMDEDDGLPWPSAERIGAWWQANSHRFAEGTRYFMGEPPSVAHCRAILKTGFQRQRIDAAEWLCLLQPGTPLFNTAAPAWRQQRRLAQMGA